ncbi:uncharacterized protein CLUP02_12277 [Colletotrichum lupini]|uniref:Uncharacterized protein n=1 Tax=Colletotrichum lupini TaxID=145971 RepID=A0A9Q8T0L7_9PEZI|nr:uncharacterized protein CLUP02_12277 [Colletotrichum lupini]UQC86775.1 hypothetical protein CLUP02_12277 [Colletotrichum lupini]
MSSSPFLVCAPGPAASTLARGGLLEQYRCTCEGLDGGVGGRVRVSFLSLPFPAALAVGNFHGALLLPRGLGCPVGSTNAKRQQRCFHGFDDWTRRLNLPLRHWGPRFLPSIGQQVEVGLAGKLAHEKRSCVKERNSPGPGAFHLRKEAGARYKQFSAASFLPSKSLRRSNGLHRYPYWASTGTDTFERKPHSHGGGVLGRHLDRLSFHLWTHRGNPLLIEQKALWRYWPRTPHLLAYFGNDLKLSSDFKGQPLDAGGAPARRTESAIEQPTQTCQIPRGFWNVGTAWSSTNIGASQNERTTRKMGCQWHLSTPIPAATLLRADASLPPVSRPHGSPSVVTPCIFNLTQASPGIFLLQSPNQSRRQPSHRKSWVNPAIRRNLKPAASLPRSNYWTMPSHGRDGHPERGGTCGRIWHWQAANLFSTLPYAHSLQLQ